MPGAAAERGLGCARAKAKGPAGSRWGCQKSGVGGGRGQVSGRDQVGRQGRGGGGQGPGGGEGQGGEARVRWGKAGVSWEITGQMEEAVP